MQRRGIIIHPQELDNAWPERLSGAGLNVLGLHPVGGTQAHLSLEAAIHHRMLQETQRQIRRLNALGIEVEYEAHAMGWLLPRSMFSMKPEWFRMNADGARVADFNLCPSDGDALEFVARRAELLARMLDTGSDRYFFWMDDVAGCRCHCEKCRGLSASDQQMIVVNAMLKGIRRYNRGAKLCYLAYVDAIEAPERIEPLEGVILEYAPFGRDPRRPLFDPDYPENVREVRSLKKLLDVFGKQDAQVLEYWMDNSKFSGWKKPPKQFALEESVMRADVPAYRSLGFESITSFGCYLGQDYQQLWGEPPVEQYGRILKTE